MSLWSLDPGAHRPLCYSCPPFLLWKASLLLLWAEAYRKPRGCFPALGQLTWLHGWAEVQKIEPGLVERKTQNMLEVLKSEGKKECSYRSREHASRGYDVQEKLCFCIPGLSSVVTSLSLEALPLVQHQIMFQRVSVAWEFWSVCAWCSGLQLLRSAGTPGTPWAGCIFPVVELGYLWSLHLPWLWISNPRL